MPSPIRKQVKLPLSVAFGVVMQGIRIRLGRSLVTLAGVILGIAFLMSILVGQSIRRGVAAEVNTRREVKRMMSFLTAETGPLDDRVIGVVQVGPLGVEELRFLKQVAAAKVSRLNWVTRNGAQAPGGLAAAGRVSAVSEPEVGRDASAVLLAGEGEVPGGAAAGALLDGARQKVLAFTRKSATAPDVPDASVVQLERDKPPEELEQERLEGQRTRFRTRWIIVISLLVTVIGISNAMLMSVTERFREIGTMKCLGALSSFVRQMFFIESGLMGLAGSILGSLIGGLFAWLAFSFTYGADLVGSSLDLGALLGYFALCVAAGVILSILAAIYPASFAARMVPATALRSTI